MVMLGNDAVGIARIAKETGLSRQTVYRRDADHDQDRYLMTLIGPASIVTAVSSNCWSMAGNDGARQNRTAKIPSQHDCAVIELGAASGPASVWCPSPVSTAGATIFGPMLRQRCQPIPHSAR
jgi:hypothetical protein